MRSCPTCRWYFSQDTATSVLAFMPCRKGLLRGRLKRDSLLATIDSAAVASRRSKARRIELVKLEERYAILTPREREVFALVAAD
jgi:hypothetical protein